MTVTGAFSGRTAIWLVAIGGTAFVAIVLAQIFGDRLGTARSYGGDASSVSAIGTRAFMRVLDRLDIPVVLTSEEELEHVGSDAVLVITDPARTLLTRDQRQKHLARVKRALVVLPKWTGPAGSPDNRWIGPVVRDPTARTWSRIATDGTVKPVRKLGEPTEDFAGLRPSLSDIQLVNAPDLTPLLSYDGGVLIGEVDFKLDDIETRMIVLADPDLIANHNLDSGDNAQIAVEMVERIRPRGAAMVFVAPFAAGTSSIWQRLFTLPYSVLTLQVLLLLVVVLWAGVGRFGSPVQVPPPLRAGRTQLIENAADLLDHARHGSTVLARYAHDALHDAAETLNGPRDLSDAETADWLDEAARQRGKPAEASRLLAQATTDHARVFETPHSLVRTALGLHRWKRTLTNDTRRHSRP